MNTEKKYLKEVAVFVVFMFLGFMLLAFVIVRDHSGIKKYCENFPSHCEPAIYPGKVIEND
jgi:hypothetical protein